MRKSHVNQTRICWPQPTSQPAKASRQIKAVQLHRWVIYGYSILPNTLIMCHFRAVPRSHHRHHHQRPPSGLSAVMTVLNKNVNLFGVYSVFCFYRLWPLASRLKSGLALGGIFHAFLGVLRAPQTMARVMLSRCHHTHSDGGQLLRKQPRQHWRELTPLLPEGIISHCNGWLLCLLYSCVWCLSVRAALKRWRKHTNCVH